MSLLKHVSEAALLARHQDTNPILDFVESKHRRYEPVVPLLCRIRQPQSLGDLLREELMLHIFVCPPGDQTLIFPWIEHDRSLVYQRHL